MITNKSFYINIASLFLFSLLSCNNLTNTKKSKNEIILKESTSDEGYSETTMHKGKIEKCIHTFYEKNENDLLETIEKLKPLINKNPYLIIDLYTNKDIYRSLKLHKGCFSLRLVNLYHLFIIPMLVLYFPTVMLALNSVKYDEQPDYCANLDPLKSFCSNITDTYNFNNTHNIFHICKSCDDSNSGYLISLLSVLIIYTIIIALLTILGFKFIRKPNKKLVDFLMCLGFKFEFKIPSKGEHFY